MVAIYSPLREICWSASAWCWEKFSWYKWIVSEQTDYILASSAPIVIRIIVSSPLLICTPVYCKFKKSFDQGHSPDDWKRANIGPVFKQGESSYLGNYQPKSLIVKCLRPFSVRENKIKHLISNKLLSNSQHGFLLWAHVQFNLEH